MLYIAALLKRKGHSVEYIDANYHPDWRERLDRAQRDHDWIGLTANALSIGPSMTVSELIREKYPDKKIIMGGPYPSIMYDELMPEYADACAVGESEYTVLEMAEGIPLDKIEGLAFMDGGELRFNGRRPLIEDIDALPFPAWEMGDVSKYRLEHTKYNPVLPIISSRGCPYNCIFCASDVIFRNRIRYRSADSVLEEMDELIYRHGAREIHFWDDNFTLRRKRTMQICEGIIKRGYKNISIMIPSGIKPDVGDYELFSTMKKAGFYSICIAVESYNQDIMNKLGKKVKVDRVRDVIAAARKAGILMNGFFMLGLPYDTEETMRRNIEHACSLPLHQAMFFITIPLPGTDLYDIAREKGRMLYHNNKNLYEQGFFLGRAAYEMPGQFDAETLEKMFRLANRKFYYRPATLLTLLLKRIHTPMHLVYLFRKFLRVVFRGRQF